MPEQHCPACQSSIFLSTRKTQGRFPCPSCGVTIELKGGNLHSVRAPKAQPRPFAGTAPEAPKTSPATEPVPHKLRSTSAVLPRRPSSGFGDDQQGSVLLSWPFLASGIVAVCVCIVAAAWLAQVLENKREKSDQRVSDAKGLESPRDTPPKTAKNFAEPAVDPAIADIQLTRAVLPSASSPEILGQVQRVVPSVVTIVATGSEDQGLGNGFLVGRKDWLLTSLHVVAGIEQCMAVARSPAGEVIESRQIVGFVGCEPEADLVVLKLGNRWLTDPLPVAREASGSLLGMQVFGVAAIDRATNYVVRGCVLGDGTASELELRNLGKGIRVIQTDLAFVPGLRGGPLFSDGGEVVGLMSLGFSKDETGGVKSPFQWVHAIAAGEIARILRGCFERPRPLAELPRYR